MPAQTEDTEQHQFRQKRKKSVEATPVPVKKVKATDVCKTGSTCTTREERLFVFLSSELSKACCLFLNNIIPAFKTVNCRLQAQATLIHNLQPISLNLLEDILSRFVRPALLKQYSDICSIDYQSRNVQKDDQDLVIGHQAKCVVEKLKPSDKKEFFEAVRSLDVYIQACPLGDSSGDSYSSRSTGESPVVPQNAALYKEEVGIGGAASAAR
ncbi:hypothetical protein HPB51_013647 [Rhipicephalus microplus]|uniref:Uncharacterized protein n=1 Tax=Rhipicephalus microplus TaxID=6941 RepID=A0A9J6EA39_RHIMP|nr:hypothetical protein HPB51_013647 [Rhipicephalus microplus]